MTDTDRLLTLMSAYLNADPCAVTREDTNALAQDCGISQHEAYLALLAAYCGLDTSLPEDGRLFRVWFPKMVKELDPSIILEDPYVQAVRTISAQEGSFELTREQYAPMELFVRDDFRVEGESFYPQLGYFTQTVPYPAVKERGRVWMTVTPNEIATIRPCAAQSTGRVVAYGLGLGYYAFHALLNPAVERVTVVERSRDVIRLFEKYLLPFFPRKDKLDIVCADAFDHARNILPHMPCDTVFTDLWHDVSDGLPLYRRMKALEIPGPRYLYWIEPTLRCYL